MSKAATGSKRSGTQESIKPVIGIDLGTTNSALAYTSGEAVEVFPIAQYVHPGEIREESLLPSFLFLEDSGPIVGVLAQRKGLENASRLVSSAKSWLSYSGVRPGYDRPGNIISSVLLGYEPEPLKPGPGKQPAGKFRNQSNTAPSYFAGCIEGSCGGGGTIRSERALTHTVRSLFFTGPLRSPLRIQNTFANECFMDELCVRAKADPVDFRLRHLNNARVVGVIKAAARAANWERRISPAASLAKTGLGKTGEVSGRGIACVDYEGGNGYAALIADVAVNLDIGLVRPTRFVVALDCGPISNPDGLRNQVEGGILQGMSRALVEEVTWDNRRITSTDWETYRSLHLDYEMPAIECVFVTPEGVPAIGAGETAITVTPAAIGNAIFDATGARLRDIPFTPERVSAAMREAGHSAGRV